MPSTRERAGGSPVTPDELQNICGSEDDVDAADQLPAEPTNPDPQNVLDRLAKHFGDHRKLSEGDWGLLLNTGAFSSLKAFEAQREISEAFQRVTYRASGHVHEFTYNGFTVGQVVALLKKKAVHVEETPIFQTLLTITLDEALPSARDAEYGGSTADKMPITNFRQCIVLLGIPGEALEEALREGKIRAADGSQQHGGYMNFEAIRAWVDAAGVKPTWSADLAARIQRQREIGAINATGTADANAKADGVAKANAENPVHQAFDLLGEWNSAGEIDAVTDRRNALRLYCEIILRMKNKTTLESDVDSLAGLCGQLHCKFASDEPAIQKACKVPGCTHEAFDRDRALRDVAALEEHDRLEALAATRDACEAEVLAAGKASAATKKRVELELEEARRRTTRAFNAQREAHEAPGQLRELRRRNPHLFD